MTDNQIREFFGLDETADLDEPRFDLGLRSRREVAEAQLAEWGALLTAITSPLEIPADLSIPAFLARHETEAEADKRRARYARKDTGRGLKAIEPYTPPSDKIRKAIAKDFA